MTNEMPKHDPALEMAILFHHAYERLAPDVGYDTKVETRVFNPDSPNGKLMVLTCREILHNYTRTPTREEIEKALYNRPKDCKTHLDIICELLGIPKEEGASDDDKAS